jgi:hypothetical protein
MNELDNKIEVTPDDWKKLANRGMWMGSVLIFSTIMLMTTCTMHSNTYDPERLREEAAIRQVEAEIERIKVEVDREAIRARQEATKAIERLIAKGVNPVAARCGIKGWSLNTEEMPCIIAAGNDNPIRQAEE